MGGGGETRGNDSIRLLAARSEVGYVDNRFKAMADEPEAVPVDCQERLTEQARRRDRERRVACFQAASEMIHSALDQLVASIGTDSRVASGARAVRRSTAALGREVAR